MNFLLFFYVFLCFKFRIFISIEFFFCIDIIKYDFIGFFRRILVNFDCFSIDNFCIYYNIFSGWGFYCLVFYYFIGVIFFYSIGRYFESL